MWGRRARARSVAATSPEQPPWPSLELGRRITSDAGATAITGAAAALLFGRLLTGNAGALAVTGTDADLLYDDDVGFTIVAEAGAVVVLGVGADLDVGVFVPLPERASILARDDVRGIVESSSPSLTVGDAARRLDPAEVGSLRSGDNARFLIED